MRTIMVINPKGGSGKSTIAANLCGFLAQDGAEVVLLDYDNQQTGMAWLQRRPMDKVKIHGISMNHGEQTFDVRGGTDFVVMDTPAALNNKLLPRWLSLADTLIIPVLPSPIDIRTANYLVYQLMLKYRTTTHDKRIGVVANRARTRANAYQALLKFITQVDIPLLTTLRESVNYLRGMEQGLSIFDMNNQTARIDMEQWQPLLQWLKEAGKRAGTQAVRDQAGVPG